MSEQKPEAVWEPLYDKVLVRRDPAPEEISGLAVPDAHRKQQNTGTVLRVGNGRWIDGNLYPLTVWAGCRVLFSRFAGVELENDENVIILREDEILAYGPGPEPLLEGPA